MSSGARMREDTCSLGRTSGTLTRVPSSPILARLAAPALLTALLAGCVSAPSARRPSPPPSRPAPTLAEQAQEQERASAPGPEHRALDVFAGAWDVELVALAADERETGLARGDARVAWILDGRFQRWDLALEIAGRRHESEGFLGFDRRARQYHQLNVTSLSSGMGIARGAGDPSAEGIRLTLEQTDPATGASVRMSSVLRSLSRDHFVLDSLATDAAGLERAVQRTHFRRAAAVTR